MNVVFISNDPSIFNPQSAARARMREYASAIGNLHIISPAPREMAPIQEDVQNGSLTLHAVHGRKPFIFGKIEKRAKRIVRERNIEIISAQDPFEYGRIAAHVAQRSSAKLHIQIHTDFLSPWFIKGNLIRIFADPIPFYNRIRVRIADSVLPQAAGVRVVSERISQAMHDRYGARVVTPVVIPISVSSEVPEAVPLPPSAHTFTFITAGRLETEKHIEDILHALRDLKNEYPLAGLLIANTGRQKRRLEKMVRALTLTDAVVFLGSRPDVRGLMRSAQAYVQASAYEGYGLTLIEAALAQIPIVTTTVGIVGEVFRPSEDVLASPVGDVTALTMHMRELLKDAARGKELAENASIRVREYLATVQTGPHAIAADLQNLLITQNS